MVGAKTGRDAAPPGERETVGSTRAAAVAAAGVLSALAVPSPSPAAVPSNRNDPCAQAGRDTCGTVGVGFYRAYRYGIRWFGDFRGVVRGRPHLFCLDLRFWYASPAYRYRPVSAAALRNRGGRPVSLERRRRLAYAIWRYGRSARPSRQAAVMLYVHSLMGDGRPGEVDPASLGPGVRSLFRRIARDAARAHGPYRVDARLPATLTVGKEASASIRVLSASGHALPHVRLSLSASGASGLPAETRTNAAGVARVALTPTVASGLHIRVRTAPLAAPQPLVLVPTAGAARANGQRLAAPASRRVTSTVSRTDVVAAPQLTAHVSTQQAAPGSSVTSTVSVTGSGGASVPVQVQLWGPYRTRAAISCSGAPYWTASFVASGDSTTTTAPVALDRAGYYAYRESVPEQPSILGSTTACAGASETTVAVAHPALTTVASPEVVRPGSRVSDLIRVHGLGKTAAAVDAELYGPFGTRAAVGCRADRLAWKGRVAVAGDGEVRTPLVTLRRPGFYGYRERLVSSSLVTGTTTACAPAVETVLAAPRIVTGRGDVASFAAAPAAGGSRPVRLLADSLGIDAPVAASAIDLVHGVLGIPTDIHRTGWWRDGASPGAKAGAILLAGHVDSAAAGRGALFSLHRAEPGGRIRLVTASGDSYAYRVLSVRTYPKSTLPTSVYSRKGRPRLVIVTCGGPFDAASGHYPDDVVVTAVPIR
jgi:hypothetical protein